MEPEELLEPKPAVQPQPENDKAPYYARAPRLAPAFPQNDALSEINTYLGPRSRQLAGTIRLMEQQRQFLKTMDVEREASAAKVTQNYELLREAQRAIQAISEKETKPELAEAAFERHRKALEDLESAVAVAHTNFVCWRTAWEQFVQTREKGKALRAELSNSPSY
jgi:hypothetical protein